MKQLLLLFIVCMASVILMAGGAWGATIRVDWAGGGDYTDLQAALTYAQGNSAADTIQVAQGTYTGNFTYSSSQGDSITLEGGYEATGWTRDIDIYVTTLDGQNLDRVLYLYNSDGGDITIEGFTIQHGNTTGDGGGVWARSVTTSGTAGDITLTDNTITDNTTDGSGGGVNAWSYSDSAGAGGTITLTGNTITGNTADSGGWCGGVYASSRSNTGTGGAVTLTNNTITDNTAPDKGGVYVKSEGSTGSGAVTLTGNTITGNTADSGWSGGVYADSDTDSGTGGAVTLTGNTITGNTTSHAGGVYASSGSNTGTGGTITLTGNTITGNNATSDIGGVYTTSRTTSGTAGQISIINNIIAGNTTTTSIGGGLMVDSSKSSGGSTSDVILLNNTITGNSADSNGGGVWFLMTDNTFYFYNNIIWGNTASWGWDIYLSGTGTAYGYNNDYDLDPGGMQDSWTYSGNNIDADPRLMDVSDPDPANWDLHLRLSSPCIEAGNNAPPMGLPATDIDGDSRTIDGDCDGTATVDMGADENDVVCHCVSSVGELTTAIETAEGNGKADIIQVIEGLYTGNFSYNSSQGYDIILLGGYTSGCASRAIDPVGTVLDGDTTKSVLYLANANGANITVDGLTIQGGDSSNGGGVYAWSLNSGADPAGDVTISNNIVTGNSCGGVYAKSETASGTAGDVTLVNNIVTGNTAGDDGGGVYAASYTTSGGAAGTVTCTNNTVTGNDADEGGGVYLHVDGTPGGTINCYNNIVRGNTATSSGDDIYLDKGTGTAYGYNNDYSSMVGTWNYGIGTNINLDPLFVGGGDYHLLPSSPCIDAGDNTAPFLPVYDFEGDDRVFDGDGDDTDTVDIGADEYVPLIYVILHRDGALWSSDTGWAMGSPPYYAGSDYARDLEYLDDGDYLILHKDGAIYDSGAGWTMTTPPYYAGTNYAVDMEVTASDADCILHRDGALWYSDTGWVMTSPPYYAGSDYARALELRADTSYVILHQYGGLYDSASGWVLTSPPYYAGSAWVVDMKLEAGGYVLLHKDGALWSTSGGWVLTSPPYYAGSDYARALELVGTDYVILHKDGAFYDSSAGWTMTSPPYYPGSNYAVDLEVR